MNVIRSNVDPEIINRTPCDMNHACLAEKTKCRVELFMDRDVQFLRCRDTRSCAFKKNYQRMFICTCPVNRASFGLN